MTATLQTDQPAPTDTGVPAPERTAEAESTPRRPSLSPSRAADFKSCPLLYRFRTIDRLPERKSRAAVRGTLVHAVLERLYDLPPTERTVDAARTLIAPAWAELREEPGVAELFAEPATPAPEDAAVVGATVDGTVPAPDGSPAAPADAGPALDVQQDASATRGDRAEEGADGVDAWLASAGALVETYFSLEDPTRIQPHGREELVEVTLPDGLLLRGYVDRLDVAPTGALRVVDYKTGGVPREAFEAKALFQMKFYALVLWRTRGVVAAQLKLLYLKDGDALTYSPDEAELVRFERTLQAIWAAIERAVSTGDFRPNRSRLCSWCDHQALCPAFGGTPPPFPAEAAAAAGWQTQLPVVQRD